VLASFFGSGSEESVTFVPSGSVIFCTDPEKAICFSKFFGLLFARYVLVNTDAVAEFIDP